MRFLKRLLIACYVLGVLGILVGTGAIVAVLYHFGTDLPGLERLARYEPPVTTRVHAGDGRLVEEYAAEHRIFVPAGVIPAHVKQAFLSAEDKSFYTHPGIDLTGLARAAIYNVQAMRDGRRPVGASTITQQVAKNFLLTNDVSIERKIKEAILAFRIEKALTKDEILELYLNEIFLGQRSYGVGAASMNYFGKQLDDLTPAELAYLAALPKAPSNYHPVRQYAAAVERRNWVIGRMRDDGALTALEAEQARATPLQVTNRREFEVVNAPWFAEEVRRSLLQTYGEDELYQGGLYVRTTLDPRLQEIADRVVAEGLEAYDRRHGYRGRIGNFEPPVSWEQALSVFQPPPGMKDRLLAAVIEIDRQKALIGLGDGTRGVVPFSTMRWARPTLAGQRVGSEPNRPSDVVAVGDIIAVRTTKTAGEYALSQVPDVDGALVALDPYTGRVLAVSGGYSSERSAFNRATQAERQPGSSFKPFVYLAALEAGHTPSTLVLDAPLVLDQGDGLGKWKPSNYSNRFYGPSPLRLGIEKSRNLMTVRLAQHIGMRRVTEVARRFGIDDDMAPVLAMALGAGETTLLKLTAAYGMLVNGGMRIEPSFIDRIQDRHGATVWRHDQRECPGCNVPEATPAQVPLLPDTRARVVDAQSAYQMTSMLHGVVERGTGARQRLANKPLAGKTGTTNDSFDSWFVGFSSHIAVGVYVGFDQPRTLGPREAGSTAAAPIFGAFMKEALQFYDAVPFRRPPGIEMRRVSLMTGLRPISGDPDTIYEAFKPGTAPTTFQPPIGVGLPRTDRSGPGTANAADRAPALPGPQVGAPPGRTAAGQNEAPVRVLRGLY